MKDELNLDFSESPLEVSFYKNRESYLGKIYSISNVSDYAIIYEKQLKAISGPPLDIQELVEVGTLSNLKSDLSKKVNDRAMSLGKNLAKIKNLRFNP